MIYTKEMHILKCTVWSILTKVHTHVTHTSIKIEKTSITPESLLVSLRSHSLLTNHQKPLLIWFLLPYKSSIYSRVSYKWKHIGSILLCQALAFSRVLRFIQVVVCLTSLFPLLLTSVPVYEPFVYHSPYDAHMNCSRLGLVWIKLTSTFS